MQTAPKPGIPKRGNSWSEYPAWVRWMLLVTALNFVSFLLISLWLGGDALGGKSEDGHFYLGYRGHYRETSESIYEYSRAHELSSYGMIVAALFIFGFPRLRNIE